MKMEKRALLAFVASILLFLAYDYFYLSPRVKEQRQQRTAEMQRQQQVADSLAAVLGVETGGTEQPTTALPGAGTVDEVGAPAGDEQQKTLETEPPPGLPEVEMADAADFTVVSPLYEITLSTAGAELVSVRLLEYETAGEPVELIAYDSDWTHARALNVTLEGSASSMSLAAVSFSAYLGGVGEPLFSGSKVTVSPSREMTEVVFRASQNGNGAIERYYRFYPDRYDFDTGVRFAASTFPAATGIWWGMGPGLRSTEANEQDDQQSFKAAVKLGEDIHRLKPGAFSKKNKEEFAGTLGWTSLQTKYFIAAMIPPEPTRATAIVSGYTPAHRISNRFMVPAIVNRGRVENSTWAYKFIPNYGLVIILISVLTKVLFYRLTHKSFKSMKDLQDLQPRIQALKEKFGDDKQRLSQETMKLYKEAGVNPLGGCLPMLLQMPVFIALFQVLRGTIELRQAPFVGWITDLSQQDVLFALPATLPVIGNAFSLLPILMGASMLAQTKIGGSITGTPGAQTTPKGFNTMLPIVFTFLFYKMPSGLVIYWIVNTVLSVAQQYYIHREPDKDKDGASDNPAPKGKPQKRRIKSKGR
jgi:YidC/Oxa1 family membrane protein insertase